MKTIIAGTKHMIHIAQDERNTRLCPLFLKAKPTMTTTTTI